MEKSVKKNYYLTKVWQALIFVFRFLIGQVLIGFNFLLLLLLLFGFHVTPFTA